MKDHVTTLRRIFGKYLLVTLTREGSSVVRCTYFLSSEKSTDFRKNTDFFGQIRIFLFGFS